MSTERFSDKPLPALEEQLERQKGILGNRALLQKLPDKGAKIQASVVKLEEEVEKRRQEAVTKREKMTQKDVEEMEWALGSISFLRSELAKFSQSKLPQSHAGSDDNDDWEDAEEGAEHTGSPNPLKIIATSQSSQRQPKTVIDMSHGEPPTNDSFKGGGEFDRFSSRMVKTDLKKPKEDTKFVPNKITKTKTLGSSSPAGSTSSTSSNTAKQGEGSQKWYEALLPPNLSFEPAKLLSMEDTLNAESGKCKEFEALKMLAPKKKVYAYDKLKEQGLLGSYTVQMQTCRPVQTDAENDDFDDDLSDDQITEESDSDDMDHDRSVNQKTSKDLSKLVNSSLILK